MEPEQEHSKRLLIAAVLGLAFLLIVGTYSLIRYGQSVPAPQETSVAEPEQDTALSLKPFQIALAGPGHDRVQLSLALGHNQDAAVKKELLKRETQIREIVLFTVQKKSRAALLAPTGKDSLSQELRSAINQVMHRKISEVYVTELSIISGK
jgi:flagellar basal body-associated protein FliL